ncbi:hypothetical protein CAPTEDRAFT_199673 [Capitella teleta]|uniref:Virilizer N-terminal domain-containing protein n=1 Tax=Capitella teleta TaxID=283909 RepID=R7U984_CAPTE|nr:hypothetical protein CAPTEDRAFT_199673 [Capitella teleta]|eukprot:ELU02701.1 hypothetical protein CAPTEDRAFT_199673 [Capitella teleta]
MGSETEVRELLFFDTFSHDNTEELNLDLVQFPRPVLIHEVRVVPLGTRVTADFPGGVRLGATTPSSFKLELFVNNLRKRNAVTFEKLGVLNYEQNVDIQLNSDARIPTDGLIVKGWYTTVTIAVYGCVTSLSEKDRSSPPPPPPTHSRSKPQGIQTQHSAFSDCKTSSSAILPNTPDDAAYTAQDASSTPSQTPSQDPWGAEGRSGSQPLYPTAAEDSYPGEHTGDSSTNSPMPDKGHRDERHSKDDWDRRSRHSRSRSKERHDYRDSREFRDREYWDSYRDRDYKDKERSWTPDRRSRSPGHDRCNWTPPPRSPSQDHEEDRRNDRPREDRTLVTVPMEDTEPGEIQEEMQATETMDIYEGIPEEIPNENKIYDNLSDGEIQDAEGDAYSEISSDENMLADIQERYADWSDVEMDDTWIGLANFNPEQCDLAPMDTFTDPGLTAYELTKQRLMLTKEADLVIPDEATQIINIVEQFKDVAHDEKWIEAMDRVPGLVVPGLVYIVNKMDKKDVLDKLVAWTFEGLNVEAAIGQPLTAYKLRHIKMGIQLAATLSSCDSLLTFTVLVSQLHKSPDIFIKDVSKQSKMNEFHEILMKLS